MKGVCSPSLFQGHVGLQRRVRLHLVGSWTPGCFVPSESVFLSARGECPRLNCCCSSSSVGVPATCAGVPLSPARPLTPPQPLTHPSPLSATASAPCDGPSGRQTRGSTVGGRLQLKPRGGRLSGSNGNCNSDVSPLRSLRRPLGRRQLAAFHLLSFALDPPLFPSPRLFDPPLLGCRSDTAGLHCSSVCLPGRGSGTAAASTLRKAETGRGTLTGRSAFAGVAGRVPHGRWPWTERQRLSTGPGTSPLTTGGQARAAWHQSLSSAGSPFSFMSWPPSSPQGQAGLVQHLQRMGVLKNERVQQVLEAVDRALFVCAEGRAQAYLDCPQPIGYQATISAPHMHAQCLELLEPFLQPGCNVLDVGSGTGYFTACCAILVGGHGKAVGVEHIPELVEMSVQNVRSCAASQPFLDSGALEVHAADGRKGWPAHAPYKAIHVGAAAPEVPPALLAQLAVGGRMVIPVGTYFQDLKVLDKLQDGSVKETSAADVRYVPLTDVNRQLMGM